MDRALPAGAGAGRGLSAVTLRLDAGCGRLMRMPLMSVECHERKFGEFLLSAFAAIGMQPANFLKAVVHACRSNPVQSMSATQDVA